MANAAAGASYMCTSAADSDVSACAAGFYEDNSGAASACNSCTTVANAAAGASYTCTNATDSDVSACAVEFYEDNSSAASVCVLAAGMCGGNFDASTDFDCDAATPPLLPNPAASRTPLLPNGAVADQLLDLSRGSGGETGQSVYTVAGVCTVTSSRATFNNQVGPSLARAPLSRKRQLLP